jgi:hypothetical protein
MFYNNGSRWLVHNEQVEYLYNQYTLYKILGEVASYQKVKSLKVDKGPELLKHCTDSIIS